MYKLPEDFDILLLKNSTISYISYGINFISLFFDDGFIQIHNSFVFKVNDKAFKYENIYPVNSDFGLLILLEKQIIDIETNKEKELLHLFFDGNIELLLYSHEMYESFEINFRGKQIII